MFVAVIILSALVMGPGALRLAVSALATLLAARSWTVQRRYANALAAAGRQTDETSAWCPASRDERRLLAASLRSTLQITCLTSLFPEDVTRGMRLAYWFRSTSSHLLPHRL